MSSKFQVQWVLIMKLFFGRFNTVTKYKIITGCGWVENAEFETLVRPDDENGAAGEGKSGRVFLVRVHHSVLGRNLAGRVRDDRVRKTFKTVVSLRNENNFIYKPVAQNILINSNSLLLYVVDREKNRTI